jgi:hypothetical protein
LPTTSKEKVVMSNPIVDRFMNMAEREPALVAELEAAGSREAMARAAARLGSERGLPFTPNEFAAALDPVAALPDGELTSDELEGVVGGKRGWPHKVLGAIYDAFGGGGKDDGGGNGTIGVRG